MAGFSRAPSAWPFEFNGLNTKDAPDQLNPAQHPIAINVRSTAERSLETRPGYQFLFSAVSPPTITTTCPIDQAVEDDVYDFTFELEGGVAPFVWSISAGALPAGLDLDPSTGIISGTPTEYGVFTFTIRVTDALGHFDEVTCSITVLPVSACGTFTQIRWAHNSRVGAFLGSAAGTVYFIGLDPDVATKLVTWRSTQFGKAGSWVKVDDSFPALDNNIISFDGHEDSTVVLEAVQETYGSGRVSFSLFNKALDTWMILNMPVVAACNIIPGNANDNGGCVSIAKRANGNYIIAYDTDVENVAGTDYFRYGIRESSDGGLTWSAELQSDQAGKAEDFVLGRIVAYSDNTCRILSGDSDTPFFGHFKIQILNSDNTLDSIVTWFIGGALSQVQQGRCVGDYATWEDSGTHMLLPQRTLSDLRHAIFTSGTAPDTNILMTGNTCFIGAGTALCPQASARYVNGTPHLMSSVFSNSVPTWFYHKQDSFLEAANEDQSGPIFSVLGEGIPGQEHSAIVAEVGGVEYYISLRDSLTAGLGMIFNFIRLDQLPTSSSQTISVWSGECAG